MAIILKYFLFAVISLSLSSQGYCQCTIESITISQTQTGKTVQSKPEWEATISNGCICTQSQLKLSCDRFQTVEAIDSSVLAQSAGECLVNNGEPVFGFSNLTFNYAWDASFSFKPLSSQINCS